MLRAAKRPPPQGAVARLPGVMVPEAEHREVQALVQQLQRARSQPLAILGLMLGGGEESAPPPAAEEETRVIPEHTRKVPKRRGPSDDWPRVRIELVPPEVEREGLDAFDVIGHESRGVLERRPASCVFVELVR